MQHYKKRLSRQEAEKYLGLSRGTLGVWASTKRYALPYIKIGSRVFYEVLDLDAFIESRKIQPHGNEVNR